MSDLLSSAKLALEALEFDSYYGTGKQAAVEALRAAIEQAEQDTKTPLKVLDLTVRVECLLRRGRVYDVETLRAMDVRHLLAIPDFGKKALKEVSEALLKYELVTERRLMRKQRDQQAEKQEPVVWPDAPKTIYLQVCEESDCDHSFDAHDDVSWCQDKINESDIPYIRADTTPPQREWQGLTDEEYEAMAEKYVTNCYFDTLKYARAIEQKLKGKNT
jgi:hypothetical protein